MNVNPTSLLAQFANRSGLIASQNSHAARTPQPQRAASDGPRIDGTPTRPASDGAAAPTTAAASTTPTEAAQPIAAPIVEPAATPQHRTDELLAAWGQSDSEYDLDNNGIVDGIDLGILLSQLQDELGATPPQIAPEPAPIEPEPQTPVHQASNSPIDSLLAAWGADGNSEYDLNADNIVDGIDLGILLARMSEQPTAGDPISDDSAPAVADEPVAAAESAEESDAVNPAGTSTPDTQSTIAEYALKTANAIFSALDQDGDGLIHLRELPLGPGLRKRFDQDGDGVIAQRTLTAALSTRFEDVLKFNAESDLDAYAQRLIDAFTGGPHPGRALGVERAHNARLDRVADRLADRLSKKAVNSESVPAIRETIDQLDLPRGIKQNLMRKVDARLPRGLSFHAVG